MSLLYYLSLPISPIVAIIILFYLKKYYDKDQYRILINAFFLGIISVIIPLVFNFWMDSLGYSNLKNLKRMLFYSFVITGFLSELGKFLILRFYVYPRERFDGPSDGIIFSIAIGLGYASIANILYIFGIIDTGSTNPILAHAYTAAPASIFFAITMGFFMGMAKLGHNTFLNSSAALLTTAFFHGLYDFCLITRDYKLLSVFTFGFMILVILLLWSAARGKIEDRRTPVNKP
ncbi:MAG: PrsW family intramembrane metalloprotease [Bacteroidetes bacterium]|nr:PrsW family intramembrane metalloprotease [Bacteroidota bacterium]